VRLKFVLPTKHGKGVFMQRSLGPESPEAKLLRPSSAQQYAAAWLKLAGFALGAMPHPFKQGPVFEIRFC